MNRTCLLGLGLAMACNEMSFADKPPTVVTVVDSGLQDSVAPTQPPGELYVEPEHFDFGLVELDAPQELPLKIGNRGEGPLVVARLSYGSPSDELTMVPLSPQDEPPWTLAPGEFRTVTVQYAPVDDVVDEGALAVADDQQTQALATQSGQGKTFEGFTSGWYVFDDGVAYETTSDPGRVVDRHGDEDLYWYEPSGVHGLIDSLDPVADFETMRQYVIQGAGGPTTPQGSFSYSASSSLATFEFATYTYFLCDVYIDPLDDPSLYTLSVGRVDDGVQVMMNGVILGRQMLGQSASYELAAQIQPGQLNSLIVILVDDSRTNKYVNDLAFYRDGVLVEP